MIFFFIATILLVILAFYDEDFLYHFGWYAVTILMIGFLTGCTSNPYEQTRPGSHQQEDTNYFPQ